MIRLRNESSISRKVDKPTVSCELSFFVYRYRHKASCMRQNLPKDNYTGC